MNENLLRIKLFSAAGNFKCFVEKEFKVKLKIVGNFNNIFCLIYVYSESCKQSKTSK